MTAPRTLGIIGDSIALTTGFAQVLRQVVARVQREAGWRMWQIASLDTPPRCDSRPYYARGITPYFPPGDSDPVGWSICEDVLRSDRPDVLFLCMDPGTARNWLERRRLLEFNDIPVVLYAPVEGAPIATEYAEAFAMADEPVTVTAWAAERLRAEHGLDVPWVYHGVDPSVWHPLRPAERDRVRRDLGWADRFVVAYVARNAGRKAHDRLMKAIGALAERYPDLLLYLHCQPFDSYRLNGWSLRQLAHYCAISDRVQYAPGTDAVRGVRALTLAERLAAADLYVHPAEVEGFGLPLAEAMACGVPVVGVADGGNMQEVVGGAAAVLLTPNDWGTWFNGAQLAHVAPEAIATAITMLRESQTPLPAGGTFDGPARLALARERGPERARAFDWTVMADTLMAAIERAAARQGSTPGVIA